MKFFVCLETWWLWMVHEDSVSGMSLMFLLFFKTNLNENFIFIMNFVFFWVPYILSVHKDIKITSHDCLCKDTVVVFNLKMENSFFFLDDDDDDDEIVTMISTTLFLFLYKMFLDDDKYKFSLIFGHNNFFF